MQALPPYAHWGRRAAAYLIDAVPPTLLAVAGVVTAFVTTETVGYDTLGGEKTEPTGAGITAMVLGYAAAVAFQVWNRWVRQGRTGQSIGKKVLGITLLSEPTMAPTGVGMAFVRDLCHLVDGVFYLGFLWPLWDAKRQTFADKLVTTVVVG